MSMETAVIVFNSTQYILRRTIALKLRRVGLYGASIWRGTSGHISLPTRIQQDLLPFVTFVAMRGEPGSIAQAVEQLKTVQQISGAEVEWLPCMPQGISVQPGVNILNPELMRLRRANSSYILAGTGPSQLFRMSTSSIVVVLLLLATLVARSAGLIDWSQTLGSTTLVFFGKLTHHFFASVEVRLIVCPFPQDSGNWNATLRAAVCIQRPSWMTRQTELLAYLAALLNLTTNDAAVVCAYQVLHEGGVVQAINVTQFDQIRPDVPLCVFLTDMIREADTFLTALNGHHPLSANMLYQFLMGSDTLPPGFERSALSGRSLEVQGLLSEHDPSPV
ncbi:hypothetical protein RI367_002418 [Sorochytrium milnesiophthora]